MSVEILDGATILNFIISKTKKPLMNLCTNVSTTSTATMTEFSPIYAELLKELQSLRVLEMHFGIDVETNPAELNLVYNSMFVQFDKDSSGAVDVEEFKAETKNMMMAMANDMGFFPVQMLLEESC